MGNGARALAAAARQGIKLFPGPGARLAPVWASPLYRPAAHLPSCPSMEVQARTSAAGAAMVTIPADEYRIGSDRYYPEEAPSRLVTLAAFQIAPTPVINAQFAAFVAASGYRTVLELPPDSAIYPGLSREQRQPASVVFRPLPSSLDRANPIDWWALVPGATGAIPRDPPVASIGLNSTRWCISPGPMPWPTAPGVACACLWPGNGSWRLWPHCILKTVDCVGCCLS